MAAFHYKIKSRQGHVSRGVIATDTSCEARRILSTKEFTLISLKPLKAWQQLFQKIELKPEELRSLFKALAQLCRAGLPLREALKALEGDGQKKSYQPLIRLLEKGLSFSGALKQSALLTNDLLLSFIKQAESSGDYPSAFDQIVTYLQWMENLKKRLKKTLSYPLFVFMLSLTLLIFLMTFVVPQLLDLYKMSSLEIPPLTRALLTMSHYSGPLLTSIGVILSAFFSVGFILINYSRYNTFLRNRFLKALLKTPLLGQHLRDILLLQYTTSVQALLEAQKDNIVRAMDCAEQNLHPAFFRSLFRQPRFYVERGSAFSEALHTHFPLPESILKILQVGERSGALTLALKHVTQYVDKNLQDSLERLIQRLGPLMLLLVGGFLLFIIGAIFLPLYGGLGSPEAF